MARAPRPPAARSFTVAEKRSITFERISLYAVFLVAIIAAVISFQALWWMGQQMGLGWASPLIPVAIDGFAIACSVGVVRSQASGEPLRERLSEWLGITLALALSIAGNVTHAWHIGTGLIPWQLTVPVAAAIPVIVAYGIHVYGRAMVRGISAHVLADDPDHLQFGLHHLGDENHPTAAQAHAPVRVGSKTPAREVSAPPARPTIEAARPERAPAPASAARPARSDDARDEVFAEYRARKAQGDRMEGGEIAEKLGLHPGRARTLRKEWDQRIADELAIAEPPRDPILEQTAGETPTQAVRTA